MKWLAAILAAGGLLACAESLTPQPKVQPAQVSLHFVCKWLGAPILDGWLVVSRESLRGRDPAYYTGDVQCDDRGLLREVVCTDTDTPGLVCRLTEAEE